MMRAAQLQRDQRATLVGLSQYTGSPRGDRLRPGWTHSRRWHLLLLRNAVESILSHPAGPSGRVVLDFGCAERPYEQLFRARFPEYLGVDLKGNPHVDLALAPDGSIPLGEGAVDCVLSSQVLEHVPEPARYLAEARRVLRVGGSLVLSTHGYWMYHADPHDYWRWTREGLLLEIRRAGFEVVEAISVFGFASSSLQLWQDATSGLVPRLVRPLYHGFVQALIGAFERWKPEPASPNASVYVVLARRV